MNSGWEKDRQQLAWLKEDLRQANKEKPYHIFVFTHYILPAKPFAEVFKESPNPYYPIEDPWGEALRQLIVEYKIAAVLMGHLHTPYVEEFHGCKLISALGNLNVPNYRPVSVYRDRIAVGKCVPVQITPGEKPAPVKQEKGTILFADDFSSYREDSHGGPAWWSSPWAVPGSGGKWYVRNGSYTTRAGYAHTGDPTWTEYEVRVRIRIETASYHQGVLFYYHDEGNYYAFFFRPAEDMILIAKFHNWGTMAELVTKKPGHLKMNHWYDVRILLAHEGKGVRIKVFLDNQQRIDCLDPVRSFDGGKIGLEADEATYFDDIKVIQ
jgi:hypothetical protein